MTAKKPVKITRRMARAAAMRVIFAAVSSGGAAGDSVAGIRVMLPGEHKQRALDDALTENILRVFDYRRDDIEQWIAAAAARPLDHMTMIERAIISAAAAEMLYSPATPTAVIINEAIELAKAFGAEGGSALVNGALNAIARDHR